MIVSMLHMDPHSLDLPVVVGVIQLDFFVQLTRSMLLNSLSLKNPYPGHSLLLPYRLDSRKIPSFG